MYVSVLPLLLLFASAICASPVVIGRRGSFFAKMTFGESEPFDLNWTKFSELPRTGHFHLEGYKAWNEALGYPKWKATLMDVQTKDENIKKVEKMSNDDNGVSMAVLKITIDKNADLKYIKDMMSTMNQGGQLGCWGWSEIPPDDVNFVIVVNAAGWETAKKDLQLDDTNAQVSGKQLKKEKKKLHSMGATPKGHHKHR